MKFLEELDSLERKRHEEVQRGVLLRAAKVNCMFVNNFWFSHWYNTIFSVRCDHILQVTVSSWFYIILENYL